MERRPIHDLFKLNPGQRFRVNTLSDLYTIDTQGTVYRVEGKTGAPAIEEADSFVYRRMINEGIAFSSIIDEDQRDILTQLIRLGYYYLAKDSDGTFWIFEIEPTYSRSGDWGNFRDDEGAILIGQDLPAATLNKIENLVQIGEFCFIPDLVYEV